MFDHGHGVASRRQHTPGGNAETMTGFDGFSGLLAHADFTGQGQQGRYRLRGPKGIPGPDGKSVHSGPGKMREVFRRKNGVTQNPVQSAA